MQLFKQFHNSGGSGYDDVIDVRTPLEFAEDRIPGSLNRPCLDNLDQRGCFKPADELKSDFLTVVGNEGGLGDAIHLCGSGVTACHNMIALEHAGFSI